MPTFGSMCMYYNDTWTSWDHILLQTQNENILRPQTSIESDVCFSSMLCACDSAPCDCKKGSQYTYIHTYPLSIYIYIHTYIIYTYTYLPMSYCAATESPAFPTPGRHGTGRVELHPLRWCFPQASPQIPGRCRSIGPVGGL